MFSHLEKTLKVTKCPIFVKVIVKDSLFTSLFSYFDGNLFSKKRENAQKMPLLFQNACRYRNNFVIVILCAHDKRRSDIVTALATTHDHIH